MLLGWGIVKVYSEPSTVFLFNGTHRVPFVYYTRPNWRHSVVVEERIKRGISCSVVVGRDSCTYADDFLVASPDETIPDRMWEGIWNELELGGGSVKNTRETEIKILWLETREGRWRRLRRESGWQRRYFDQCHPPPLPQQRQRYIRASCGMNEKGRKCGWIEGSSPSNWID